MVHDRSHLTDVEKLVYLRQAVKNGSAKNAIEGLSRSGDHYHEAVECLLSHCNRIHQAHVRVIMDAPSLKDDSGKELQRLYDTIQQHLRALRSMDYKPSGTFIISVIKLKLDTGNLFEWQNYSQGKTKVPHYNEFLEFIDLRVQASETSLPTPAKKPPQGVTCLHQGNLHRLVKLSPPSPPIPIPLATPASSAKTRYIPCMFAQGLRQCRVMTNQAEKSMHELFQQQTLF